MTAITAAPAATATERADRRSPLGALHPLLFAAYPVLFLWSQNLGEVAAPEVVVPLLALVAAAAVATFLLGRLLGVARRGALIVTPILLGLLMYEHVDDLLDDVGVPARLQQLGWAVLVVLAAIGALRLGRRNLDRLDTGLLRIGAVLVGVTMLSIVPTVVASTTGSDATLKPSMAALATTTDQPRRDVYWLVFDRYGSGRSIESAFGVENDLPSWLREQGFTVLDDSHANYVKTALSMATTLNLTHLDPLVEAQGPQSGDHGPVYESFQDSLVARQFKALGYRYLHVGSWWGPSRTDVAADVNYNAVGVSDFISTMYEQTALPVIGRLIGAEGGSSLEDRQFTHGRFGLDTLERLRNEPGPKFVLGHILLPHPPYVFDRTGEYNGEGADSTQDPQEFADQLAYTNQRLRDIIGGLLGLPEAQRPIIILQGDEGPWTAPYEADPDHYDWASAPPEDLEIKFGILNSWFVPGTDFETSLDPSTSAINTFPILFSRYFGLDYEPLPDRVSTSRSWDRPYELTDVTDRLPSLR